MAVFDYRALDGRYLPASGTITADTARQARDVLRGRGLLVEQVDARRPAGGPSWRSATPVRPGRREASKVGPFARQLATLLAVGSPLLEAIDTLAKQHGRGFRRVLLLLRDDVAAGTGLAAAMARQPAVFDSLCLDLVRVGEDSGTLDVTLGRLAAFKDRSRQFKGKLLTAMLYPCFVLVFAVGVSVFLMTSVVPNLLEPLLEQGRPLPLPTVWVKAASDALVADGLWMAAALVAVAAAAAAGWRTDRGRRWADAAVLRVPVVGDLARKQAIVRIAVVMGTLLKSGLVLVRALQAARDATPNRVIRAALAQCEAAVAAGSDVAVVLERTRAFPPLVVHLFALGQQSGRLEDLLSELADGYDAEVATAAQRLAAVLEPALILVLAGLVLCIVLATMLPIMEAGDVLH